MLLGVRESTGFIRTGGPSQCVGGETWNDVMTSLGRMALVNDV